MKWNRLKMLGAMTVLMGALTACSCSGTSGTNGQIGLPGNVPGAFDDTPTPQAPEIVAPYLGRWDGGPITVVFLPDGHVAITNRYSTEVPNEIGTYQVNTNNSIDFEWLFSGHEHAYARLANGVLELQIYELTHTANASAAQDEYNRIYQPLVVESAQYLSRFPVGPASGAASKADPNPSRTIAGATVYSGEGIHAEDSFGSSKWYTLPDNTIATYDGYSRVDVWMMPNGRFASEVWLWEGVDEHDQSHVKHYLSWGSYSVKPGDNPLTGDTVSVVYDDNSTSSYKMVGGRRYLRSKIIVYHNAALKKTP